LAFPLAFLLALFALFFLLLSFLLPLFPSRSFSGQAVPKVSQPTAYNVINPPESDKQHKKYKDCRNQYKQNYFRHRILQ
jgi:hypothetical protein